MKIRKILYNITSVVGIVTIVGIYIQRYKLCDKMIYLMPINYSIISRY